jgi:NAD(P)-dependent dehydrogenase (short-subunit alcohol dehydrogenase family)
MIELSGRGAIAVGTRRVGATVVRRLAREGVSIAIVYRRSRDEAEALLESIRADSPQSCLLQADLSVESDVQGLVEAARRELGDLSFVLNLASDYPRVRYEDLDGAAWDKGMAAARGAFLLNLYASRAMLANSGPTRGHIINFGDWAAGETPYEDHLPYLTAKAAVHFMVRAFAVELTGQGILFNAILPGPTARPPNLPDAEWETALKSAPLRRESSPDDIAEIIVALLRSDTITGENIHVDSGRHVAGNVLPN